MAMAADWSSLPSDLLGLVADSLLSTGDVDCYVSFRAVCHNWRGATADPCGLVDPRFRPRSWIMLDWRAADAQDFRRLFLNIDTGRLVEKNLPVLGRYVRLATDHDGLLVLQRSTESKNLFALNPFTGAWICLHSYPAYAHLRGRVFAAGSSPAVALYSFKGEELGAVVDLNSKFAHELIFPRPALDSFYSVVSCQGRVYAMDTRGTIVALKGQWRITTIVVVDPQQVWRPSFLVDNSGELLVVRLPGLHNTMQVFRVDLEKKVLRMINSIGNRVIFLGDRSLSTYAGHLPTIKVNCIYYVGGVFGLSKTCGIYMHSLEDGGREKLVETIQHVAVEGNRQPQLRSSVARMLMDYANYGDMTAGTLGAYAPATFIL